MAGTTTGWTRERTLAHFAQRQDEFARRFGVHRIGLFGSRARGDATDESDVDILVEMQKPTFDTYMDLKCLLEDLFGCNVDLVLADRVKPRLRPIIMQEVIYA